MKFNRDQFNSEFYLLWEKGLLLPLPLEASDYSVIYQKNHSSDCARITLKAANVKDALERACYAITYTSPWRPEEINLCAVYDCEENEVWIDKSFPTKDSKIFQHRKIHRRDLLAGFCITFTAILYGMLPRRSSAGIIPFGFFRKPKAKEQLYTSAGTYSWIVPNGVTLVHVVCVGGGASGNANGGGGLGWKNNISVTPGQAITVVVGSAGPTNSPNSNGGNSYFINTTTVCGFGGASNYPAVGGSYAGDGGGTGGGAAGLGGGGAGGYTGAGGLRLSGGTDAGISGSGGAGGAGGYWGQGGGVGIYGIGASGTSVCCHWVAGNPGSGGVGTQYGGGGAYSGFGGSGAVRIIWGSGKSFPSNAS